MDTHDCPKCRRPMFWKFLKEPLCPICDSEKPPRIFSPGVAMETFNPPKITGYRQLTQDEVNLMNEGKALAEQCGSYIAKLRTHVPSPPEGPAYCNGKPTLDHRWISIGATDLQRGFMAITRGIAQPTTF